MSHYDMMSHCPAPVWHTTAFRYLLNPFFECNGTSIYTHEIYMLVPLHSKEGLSKYLKAVVCQTGAGQCDIMS